MRRVLITGGAGFIGSHVADALLQHGLEVRVLDSLSPQVHGADSAVPSYLAGAVELVRGDVRDAAVVQRALKGCDAVFHFAARVGVGQSMYEMVEYSDTNVRGTAVLLEALMKQPISRLIVASSMSIYGEGLYQTSDGRVATEVSRRTEDLRAGTWEPSSPEGERLNPVPTPENKVPSLASVYALSKYSQERMVILAGNAYGIPSTALRLFNVYGPRQALSNPYTGVLAVFASRLLNGRRPMVFEDGLQRRDFVSVHDVAEACLLALRAPDAHGAVLNIGSGNSYSIRELAERTARALGRPDIEPEITGKHRVGDIRHCFADISLARELIGYSPRVTLEEGMRELAGWLEGKSPVDRVAQAREELAIRGLTI